MRHIIKRQTLQFDLGNKLDVFTTQQEIDQFNKNKILPVLEKVFDELSEEEKLIAIEKIEIDLGFLTVKEMETKTSIDLYEAIMLQVKKAIRDPDAANSVIFSRVSKVAGVARQWLFYMQHGYLPWNTIQANADWYNETLEAFAVEFESITALRQLIITDHQALKRIIYQHHEKFLQQLIEVLTAQKQIDLLRFIDEFVRIFLVAYRVQYKSVPVKLKDIKEKIWSLLFTGAAKGEKNLTRGRWMNKILKAVIKDKESAETVMNNLSGHLLITLQVVEEILKETELLLPEKLPQPEPDKGGIEISEKKSPGTESQEKQHNEIEKITNKLDREEKSGTEPDKEGIEISEKNIDVKNIISAPEKNIPTEITSQVDAEGLFIVNAGTVLLHPFLNHLFKKLRVIEEKEFISNEAHQKALYLLHYLATGRMVPEEHELTIAKVLCAYGFDEAVSKDIELNNTEISEADDLIEAVVSQWTILKNTSPDGLREGFLQRKGKLYSKNNNLYLHVEASSIDMLLDYIPWNIGMIKLPWMKEMLRVEWR